MEHLWGGGRRNGQELIFFLFFLLFLTFIMILLYIRMRTLLSRLSRTRQQIAQLARRRREAERVLLERSALLKGILVEVRRTCGKGGCKCGRGQKHRCWQLSASVEGRRRTWNVPRRYVAKVKELTGNYRRFRRARAVWVRLKAEMLKRINEMEAARTVADFRDE